MKNVISGFLLCALCLVPAQAQLFQGSLLNYSAAFPPVRLGTAGHHVTFTWSNADFNFSSGYAYGSDFSGDTDVAIATGVTNIAQITDASAYSFTTGATGVVYDAGHPGQNGIGTFVVLRHNSTQEYGVIRFDDIDVSKLDRDFDDLDATWWFRADGGRDFSGPSVFAPVPEPATIAVFAALGLLGVAAIRARRANPRFA